MTNIKLEKFAEMTAKDNHLNKAQLVESLRKALDAENHGAKCMICGAPI